MEWTDGCPFPLSNSSLETAFHGPSPMEDCPPGWNDFALAASHTSKMKIFYAFLSGIEEGGSCPTLQLNTEEDHLKID